MKKISFGIFVALSLNAFALQSSFASCVAAYTQAGPEYKEEVELSKELDDLIDGNTDVVAITETLLHPDATTHTHQLNSLISEYLKQHKKRFGKDSKKYDYKEAILKLLIHYKNGEFCPAGRTPMKMNQIMTSFLLLKNKRTEVLSGFKDYARAEKFHCSYLWEDKLATPGLTDDQLMEIVSHVKSADRDLVGFKVGKKVFTLKKSQIPLNSPLYRMLFDERMPEKHLDEDGLQIIGDENTNVEAVDELIQAVNSGKNPKLYIHSNESYQKSRVLIQTAHFLGIPQKLAKLDLGAFEKIDNAFKNREARNLSLNSSSDPAVIEKNTKLIEAVSYLDDNQVRISTPGFYLGKLEEMIQDKKVGRDQTAAVLYYRELLLEEIQKELMKHVEDEFQSYELNRENGYYQPKYFPNDRDFKDEDLKRFVDRIYAKAKEGAKFWFNRGTSHTYREIIENMRSKMHHPSPAFTQYFNKAEQEYQTWKASQ